MNALGQPQDDSLLLLPLPTIFHFSLPWSSEGHAASTESAAGELFQARLESGKSVRILKRVCEIHVRAWLARPCHVGLWFAPLKRSFVFGTLPCFVSKTNANEVLRKCCLVGRMMQRRRDFSLRVVVCHVRITRSHARLRNAHCLCSFLMTQSLDDPVSTRQPSFSITLCLEKRLPCGKV